MNKRHDPNTINRLIGRFADLQERWQNNPASFDWADLQALAQEGAHAYNEGAGPSFHALALDGTQHTEFHERFLTYSLEAGFDPFKLVKAGSGDTELPVIDHAGMAEEAQWNASSARMRAALMDVARTHFTPLAQEMRDGKADLPQEQLRIVEAGAESIPADLLEQIAPNLLKSPDRVERKQDVDPVEGYLSTAEVMVDSNSKPYG
ncbi:hypothetical protein D3870_19000 [Noviherbaspirillum cavernae]|uniref:Uncharacterized protein n=1 Tax=Noviherbaspirillum cavernae TaxID=2320862 RepID=A0A418WV00_9BURK|nr:hypothetical protein [Noviherbaspirillum cavernae]RJF96536.1 hypothetical protein D3870_19000 [Noviherbaspirillum cavernae]